MMHDLAIGFNMFSYNEIFDWVTYKIFPLWSVPFIRTSLFTVPVRIRKNAISCVNALMWVSYVSLLKPILLGCFGDMFGTIKIPECRIEDTES